MTNLDKNDLFTKETFVKLEKELTLNKGDKIQIINYGSLISCDKDLYLSSPEYPIYREYEVETQKRDIDKYIDYDYKPELIRKEFIVKRKVGYYIWTTTGEVFNVNQVTKIIK